jgi:hypothetical protein
MRKLSSLFLLGILLLAACVPALPRDGEVISWDRAVQLLNSGAVTQVIQAHSLEVTLTLTNGAQVTTIEPSIDEIFREIEKCGAKCAGIVQATE